MIMPGPPRLTPIPGQAARRASFGSPTPTPTPTPSSTSASLPKDCPPCALADIGTIVLFAFSKQCVGNPDDAMATGYASRVSIDGASGQSIETFKDTILAYRDTGSSGDPSNKTTIDNLAKQFVSDYIAWKCNQFDISYNGLISPTANGLLSDIEWTFGSGKEICRTRLISAPWNFHFQELGHFDWPGDCTLTATPCIYFYGPPCVGSTVVRWKLCLEDGRLREYYVSTDTV